MSLQSDVKGTLRAHVELVKSVVTEFSDQSRTHIARVLCEQLNLKDFRGRLQLAGCLKALRELDGESLFSLPAPRRKASPPVMRRLERAVLDPQAVPDQVEEVRGLRLVLVEDENTRRVWNELVMREHPFGTKPLVGRQLRYLIESDHGFLGAVGFASAALRLRQRDHWIGWNESGRREHLHRVVGLARLLVRSSVRCANLASHVLKLTTERMPEDFERLYGYRPWLLETFVEADIHSGASHRAAGWLWIGSTQGRGRQDTKAQGGFPKKEIFVHVLDPAFRDHMGIVLPKEIGPLEPAQGLDSSSWADNEFGEAELGDRRLTRRLVSIADHKGASPGTPFSELVAGNRAEASGYYRFVERPEDSGIDMDAILAPHRERTVRRMQAQRDVLCIHDTTDLNFSTLKSCEGLGVIGKNQTSTETRGLRLHTSLAVEATDGVPLGIVAWRCDAPEVSSGGKKPDPRMVPAEDKETWRWIESLGACIEAERELTQTRVIHVMDREGDFFELFHQWRQHQSGRDEILVRAKHNRNLKGKGGAEGEDKGEVEDEGGGKLKIFDHVAGLEPQAEVEVRVPRRTARAKKGTRAAQPVRQARIAILSLRWTQVLIQPPSYGPSSGHPPVRVWLLHAREDLPPGGQDNPLEWFLLTSVSLDDRQSAIRVLEFYAKRWRIEDWHRILKTCCRAEKNCLRDAEFLKRVLAINMVVAWRVHLMTLLGREVPQLPMETLFSNLEIKVLQLVARREKLPTPACLGGAINIVARLGGYYNRPHDPLPGALILSRGTMRLMSMCDGVELLQPDYLSGDKYG
jgi:hypothetical protein